jgi:hypothetical protein
LLLFGKQLKKFREARKLSQVLARIRKRGFLITRRFADDLLLGPRAPRSGADFGFQVLQVSRW